MKLLCFMRKQKVLFACSSLERTEPDLLTDRPDSSAKLFRELDKISDKSGLRFTARHNKCFLFLVLVMASGPGDCYRSAFRGRSSFPQRAQYRQHQLIKDHEATLKKTPPLCLLLGLGFSAAGMLNSALQKDRGSKLAC